MRNELTMPLQNTEKHQPTFKDDNLFKDNNFFKFITRNLGHESTRLLKDWVNINDKIITSKEQMKILIKYRKYDHRPPHILNIKKNLQHIKFHSITGNKKFMYNIQCLQTALLNIEIEDLHIHINYLIKKLDSVYEELLKHVPFDIVHDFVETQIPRIYKYKNSLKNKLENKFDKNFKVNLSINDENIHNTRNINTVSVGNDNVYIDDSNIDNNNNNINASDYHNSNSNISNNNNYQSTADNTNSVNYSNINLMSEKWFHNLTDLEIPKDIIEIVSLGPKFNFQHTLDKENIIKTIKNTQQLLDYNNQDDDIKSSIKTLIVDTILSHKEPPRHISYKEKINILKLKKASAYSKENKIMYTVADKGGATVAIKVDDYKVKMKEMLSDTNTYKKLDSNPLPKLINKTKKLLKEWNDRNIFPKKLTRFDTSLSDTSIAKIYGLPKTHKPNYPMRPIVSNINTPTSFLSRFIHKILSKSLIKPFSYIKNSSHLIEKLKNLNVPDDHVLISLDVTALYTNVPIELVKHGIERRFNRIRQHTNLTLQDLFEAVDILMSETYFQFDNEYYQQIHGCAMGSSVSCLFADMVMHDLEIECLNNLDFRPVLYKRYVDDIIAIVPRHKVPTIEGIFNSYDPRLQFTVEMEKERRIPFLELEIIIENNVILTNWYRKATASDRVLNFKSNHPINQKIAQVYNLVDRSITLSNERFQEHNLKIVEELLIGSDYPKSFIKKYMQKRIHNKHTQTSQNINDNNNNNSNEQTCDVKKKYLCVPYIGKFYKKIANRLKPYNIQTIPIISNNLKHLIRKGKDLTPKLEQQGVVYKICCNKCNISYIGETKRALGVRMSNHTSKLHSYKEDQDQYVITQHIINNPDHSFDFNKVKILDKETNENRRKNSEIIHINITPDTINKKTNNKGFGHSYTQVFNMMKHKFGV